MSRLDTPARARARARARGDPAGGRPCARAGTSRACSPAARLHRDRPRIHPPRLPRPSPPPPAGRGGGLAAGTGTCLGRRRARRDRLRHSLAFEPDFPEGENGLGLVARTRGDLAAARRSFERAISLRPTSPRRTPTSGSSCSSTAMATRRSCGCAPPWTSTPTSPTRARTWGGCWCGVASTAARTAGGASPQPAASCCTCSRRSRPVRRPPRPRLLSYLEQDYARAEASYRRAAELDPVLARGPPRPLPALVRLARCGEAVRACERCLEVAPGAAACRTSLRGARACE